MTAEGMPRTPSRMLLCWVSMGSVSVPRRRGIPRSEGAHMPNSCLQLLGALSQVSSLNIAFQYGLQQGGKDMLELSFKTGVVWWTFRQRKHILENFWQYLRYSGFLLSVFTIKWKFLKIGIKTKARYILILKLILVMYFLSSTTLL
jgi:hypothetical protein